MTVAASLPGPANVFVPNHEATNRLVIDFARNPNKFALPRYVQYAPVKQVIGLFQQMTVEERGRVLTTNADEFDWQDGTADTETSGNDGTEYFIWKSYTAKRKRYRFNMGEMTSDQATWDINNQHMGIKLQQALTARTLAVYNVLSTSGNYATNHTSAVASISGNTGNFAQSTTARGDIKRSLFTAYEAILDDTLDGVGDQSNFNLIIGSGLAAEIAESQEIVDYIKSSPDAYAQIRGELRDQNPWALYGLPSHLYGFPLVIEKTRRVTSRKGTTRAVSKIWPNSTAVLAARPGGLDAPTGGPSFSTCTVFIYEKYNLLAEQMYDQNNKRTIGRIVDCFDVQMTANASGYLFTSAG